MAVKGNPATRQLVGYVEYFAAFRNLILLSSEYDGADSFAMYSVDPTTGRELNIRPDLNLAAEEVVSVCSGRHNSVPAMFAAISPVMGMIYQKRRQRELEQAVLEAFFAAMKKVGLNQDELPTAELMPEIIRLFQEEIAPYAQHIRKINKPAQG